MLPLLVLRGMPLEHPRSETPPPPLTQHSAEAPIRSRDSAQLTVDSSEGDGLISPLQGLVQRRPEGRGERGAWATDGVYEGGFSATLWQ
ncbi:hypothetical protein AAFF_G00049510 [Aldrovandia affinis]|uniref:Uncharacterized protein n=1 Tax=Aldrovandia affinis TaxID=143900 RepID=A0AAD7S3Q3_9TELE|nr:hypothetical protein AAFF_G00049510 [Aldrovandia affinis]